MHYRARDTKAPSAWIADSRGAYTHDGATVCPGFFRYKGFMGCPAWAAGKPCEYCFLKTTLRTDKELLGGMAWGGRVIPCEGCDPTASFCDRGCEGVMLAPARAALEKWLKQTGCVACGRRHRDLRSHEQRREGQEWKTVRWCGHCRRSTELRREQPMLLNAGELADSLGFTPEENPHLGMLLDLFSSRVTNPHGHKILFVTKAGLEATKAHLAGRQPSENVILSWSFGNLWGERFEPHWGPLDDLWAEAIDPHWNSLNGRLAAAGYAIDEGWRVRLRLDPLAWDDERVRDVCYGPQEHGYQVGLWFAPGPSEASPPNHRFPELITLGTLRHQGGRVMLPEEQRVGIYREAIEGLREGGYDGRVGLCKESRPMIHKILGIEPEEMPCNCLP